MTIVDVDAPPQRWARAVEEAAAYTTATAAAVAARRFVDSAFAIDTAATVHLEIYRRWASTRPGRDRDSETSSRPPVGSGR